jgi:hypothetical protein
LGLGSGLDEARGEPTPSAAPSTARARGELSIVGWRRSMIEAASGPCAAAACSPRAASGPVAAVAAVAAELLAGCVSLG